MIRNIFCLLLFVSLLACDNQNDIPETATSGNVKIAFDEAFKSIAVQEKVVFEYLYKHAKVKDFCVSQEQAHQLLLRDSVKLIFSSRQLNKYENDYLSSRNVFSKTFEFASYGIVILLNTRNKDSVINLKQLKEKLYSKKNSPVLVVDNSKGSALYSVLNLLGLQTDSLSNVFSADSTTGVIDYVVVNENAIGIISSTFISDGESPQVQKLRKKVRIAKMAKDESSFFYHPFQSEITDSVYPLISKIYIISRESKMGTANGFASFLLGEKGQRILLKAGLVPARMPGREVVLSKKDIR